MDIEEVLIANQVIENLLEADAFQPARQIYNAIDPFTTMNDHQFMSLFRVSKNLAEEIIDLVSPYMTQGHTYSSLEIKTKVTNYTKELIKFNTHGFSGSCGPIILCPRKLPKSYRKINFCRYKSGKC